MIVIMYSCVLIRLFTNYIKQTLTPAKIEYQTIEPIINIINLLLV